VSRPPLYIAVEGPIGVGKTTLVHALRERLDARLVLENFDENPFLPLFYEDRDRYAFQTQIFFLMSRFRQQSELLQPDLFQPDMVADYHLLKDRIFAQLTLADEELALYEQVYKALERHILQPDVMVYLHANLDELLRRIDKRGRAFERDFDAEYLEQVSRTYHDFFARYDRTPLVSLDTTHLDLVNRPELVDALYEEILVKGAENPRRAVAG